MQPQMGGPMGNPMMGGPPGMRPSHQQMRRGTPKAVPVMVSAGLAIGVFCGLLFGLGTGEDDAQADTTKEKKFVGTKIDGTDESATTPGAVGPTPPKSVTDGTLATGTIKEPKGSAAGSATAGAAQGSAAGTTAGSAATVVPPPTVKMAKLVISLKPDTVKDAKITVDGTEVQNNTLEVSLGDKTKKEVVVTVKAPGFKDLEQKLEVDEGEMKVEYQLVKKSSGGGSVTPRRPDPPGGKGGKKGGGKKGGGLIDI
jgi:hypothetical protein